MAIIRELNGVTPIVGERTFLAETATLIGSVSMGEDCSIWYGAVLRADVGAIRLGDRVNVQDNAVLHATYKQSECVIGNDVSIGHGANVHGAVIGSDVIIGMGAIVLGGAELGDGCLVAAGSVVTGKTKAPAGWLLMGNPAKLVRNEIEVVVQVNGKVRGRVAAEKDCTQETVEEAAMKLDTVKAQLEGKTIRKIIFVKNKLLNIVAN